MHGQLKALDATMNILLEDRKTVAKFVDSVTRFRELIPHLVTKESCKEAQIYCAKTVQGGNRKLIAAILPGLGGLGASLYAIIRMWNIGRGQ